MIVAHLSDPHVLDLHGVPLRTLLSGKRCTGAVNLLLMRQRAHRYDLAQRIAEDVAKRAVDHVVITGDMTNLALDTEFALCAKWLESNLGLAAEQVSIVPGNHDRYTRGAARSARFEQWLGSYAQTELPSSEVSRSAFPFVRLRGPLAIIGLNSAVPRPPFVAAGVLGAHQLARLRSVLLHPEVTSRTAVVAIHHPPRKLQSRQWLNGLRDWQALSDALGVHPPGLLLHGHLHRRVVSDLESASGRWTVVGATSASLAHADSDRVAGYNEYHFDDRGTLLTMRARILSPGTGGFETRELRR